MRKQFFLTNTQLTRVLKASKPTPLIMLQCGVPPSPQEKANAVWKELGKEMGFEYMTVKPFGQNQGSFTAETTKEE